MAKRRVLVPLADGVEELEAVTILDVLRRAGWEVVGASVGAECAVKGSRGVGLMADTTMPDTVRAEEWDLLVLPGGVGGVRVLAGDRRVLGAARTLAAAGKYVAAICAAPVVLEAAGLLAGRRMTCYPGTEAHIRSTTRVDERVVVDGRLVTSQGPGTALEFALTLVRLLDGAPAAQALAGQMLAQG